MININTNYLNLKESYLFSDINKKIKEYKKINPDAKIIRLGIGDVTLPLPKLIVDGMVKASQEMGVKDTFRGYPPEFGHDFLRNNVKAYYKRYNVDIDLDDIFISDGAKSDMGNLLDIFGKNNILIPDPVYPVYLDTNIMHNNNVIFIDGNKDNNFLPLPNDSLYGKSYIIYICSPNNPTGASYNKEQLKEWVSFAKKTESLIIYDAAYEAFIDNDVPHSIYEIDGASSIAIEVASFSKFAGFTGIRCGYTIVPSSININGVLLNKLWKRRQSTKFNGVSYITQVAASVALTTEGIKECQKNLCYYKENARLLKEFFKKKGIWFSGGDNSPYIWLECPFGMSSWEFFQFLLEKCNVIGTPGVGFGKNGEGFFRITSFGTKEDTLEAIRRMDLVL